jgi:ribonuclease E
VRGSTRLEAKKQRRREGREAGRRRPVITEAEFLARRESVERVMVVRENEGRTQIAVLEDGVLVEHYVARRTQTSMVGNVYLGRVQNVLPSMEAAFVDIGKGRNAVLYAGEVNWDAAGLDGQPKRIEHALKSGESVLVQVTKDPIGHKGARLTSQVSLPGRYLVYVPDGSMTGISRKLPDTERARLKRILRDVVPEDAGVIVRTAAEGASEEELGRDVARLSAQWADIAAKSGAVNAPALLYGEPDLAIRVVRDIFNEDFASLVISGDDTWDVLHAYIGHVAPDLVERLTRWNSEESVDGVVRGDAFAAHRIDEQLAKALDRKVWLPSGGSLVIDRTEAMTVVDVNTGKFTGAGGNLEETVTKNNVEAAEEIVRQLRLRDIGGIIVVDFIDMVLESNRDLVLRRLLECLGRDRTKHQVAEVTSLGLVQMTRKRVGQGLLEVFSETCEHCNGRGVIVHDEPVEKRQSEPSAAPGRPSRSNRGPRGGRGGGAGAAPSVSSGQADGNGQPSSGGADTLPGSIAGSMAG